MQPRFTHAPVSVQSRLGQRVELLARFSGQPPPVCRWFKGDVGLEDGKTSFLLYNDPTSLSLLRCLHWLCVLKASAVTQSPMARTVRRCRFYTWRMNTLENTSAQYATTTEKISPQQWSWLKVCTQVFDIYFLTNSLRIFTWSRTLLSP